MDTKEIITLAVAVAGWIYAGFTQWLGYRERLATRKEDQLFKALSWFEGKTQRRSIGVAVVEGLWQEVPDYRKTLIPLLANQAIYLLAESDSSTAHERNNVERIMRLVLDGSSLRADFPHLHTELLDLTSPTSTRRGPTGNSVDPEKLNSWHESLT
jgi:hypothetical protein